MRTRNGEDTSLVLVWVPLSVRIRVYPWLLQFKAQLSGEPLRSDTVERRQVSRAASQFLTVFRMFPFHRGNHQIFRGMLGGNELEYFGLVPGPFEQGSAQRVGDKLRLPLTQDAVPEGFSKNRRRPELGTQFLVTARCNQYQCSACLDTFREGVVRRRVARVQGNEDIDLVERRAFDRAGFEPKSAEPALTRSAIAQLDQLGSRLDSANRHLSQASAAQKIISGEGQVALAAAHIDETEVACLQRAGARGLRRRDDFRTITACRVKQGPEDFDKMVDLPEFRLHTGAHFAFCGRYAESV